MALARVTVKVIDENDNYPVFQMNPVYITVPESIQPGNTVAKVVAYDKDKGENGRISYFLLTKRNYNDRLFSVDKNTGEFYNHTKFKTDF